MAERAAPWPHLSSSSCSSALTILSCPPAIVGRRRRLKIQRTEDGQKSKSIISPVFYYENLQACTEVELHSEHLTLLAL